MKKISLKKQIRTKARSIQMNPELLEYCKKEINDLLSKKLIRPSHSPWSCATFYVQKASEIECGTPRLVINYKPLNKVLQWISYLIPNKKYLIQKLYNATIFSKFDMKSIDFGKFRLHQMTDIKQHLQFHLGIMNGMLCHLV